MNALHILCSNPNVTSQMIFRLISECPSLLTMQCVVDNMTPLMMFMRCKRIQMYRKSDESSSSVEDHDVSLLSCIQQRIVWNNIECILLMDASVDRSKLDVQDEQTGLYPWMKLAFDKSSYGLDTMFGLLSSHPFLLSNI